MSTLSAFRRYVRVHQKDGTVQTVQLEEPKHMTLPDVLHIFEEIEREAETLNPSALVWVEECKRRIREQWMEEVEEEYRDLKGEDYSGKID